MAAEIVLRESFTDQNSGAYINITSAVLEDPTGTFGIKRNDTDAVVIPSGTAMNQLGMGLYNYEFDEPVGEDGLTYTYYVKWVYNGNTFFDEHQVTGGVDSPTAMVRSSEIYLDWMAREFSPIELVTPNETIEQMVENAIRYWNTHSAYRCVAMYDYPQGAARIQLSPEFKMVTEVLPANKTEGILEGHPLWTLAGVTLMDSVRTDLIMMAEGFRNYKQYVGMNFRHHFERSIDPTVGGHLYATHLPLGSPRVCVIGTKRIMKNENIRCEHILDWILRYTKALVKQVEGNSLRKVALIDTNLDGDTIYKEGREEMKELQDELHRDARWVVFIKRK